MGFRLPKTHATIEFAESSPYRGAEVVMSLDSTLDDALQFEQLIDGASKEVIFDTIGEVLVSWNLEDDDGQAIPCDAAHLRRQPMPFVIEVFKGYQRAMGQVVAIDDPFARP